MHGRQLTKIFYFLCCHHTLFIKFNINLKLKVVWHCVCEWCDSGAVVGVVCGAWCSAVAEW